MANPSFLFDTYSAVERNLPANAMTEALCAAVRLGRGALAEERAAVLLLPLLRHHQLKNVGGEVDEDVACLLRDCAQLPAEDVAAYAARLAATANVSAIRVALAELYQQEYGDTDSAAPRCAAMARRKAIRLLCSSMPAATWSDLIQGELKPEDADFLACPNFAVIPLSTSVANNKSP